MNHGGVPQASRAPIIEPAEVPTMKSALPGSHPLSVAIACSAPASHAPPSTPPAPSTSPTFGRLAVRVRVVGGVARDITGGYGVLRADASVGTLDTDQGFSRQGAHTSRPGASSPTAP